MQILALSCKPSVIQINVGGNKGRIYMDHGHLTHVEYRNLTGLEALQTLLIEPVLGLRSHTIPCVEKIESIYLPIDEVLINLVLQYAQQGGWPAVLPHDATRVLRTQTCPVCVEMYDYQLEVRSGPQEGMRFALQTGDNFTGNSPGCDVPIMDPFASRRHGIIHVSDHAARYIDLGSTNGSCLNDRPVKDVRLQPDDILRIGNTRLQFMMILRRPCGDRPPPPATKPAAHGNPRPATHLSTSVKRPQHHRRTPYDVSDS